MYHLRKDNRLFNLVMVYHWNQKFVLYNALINATNFYAKTKKRTKGLMILGHDLFDI